MAKHYKTRQYEQVRVASLLSHSAQQYQPEPILNADNMTLDEEFKARGKALKLAMENGVISTQEAIEKLQALKAEYQARKAAA